MIPLIQREAVEHKGWVTDKDIVDIIAIAESTPGVIAVNSATFVGYRAAGVFGSVCATAGVVAPSFIVICIISLFFEAFRDNQWVSYAFEGIRCAVVLLIANAVVKLSKGCKLEPFHIFLMAAAFGLAAFTGFDTILILILAGILGVLYAVLMRRRKEAAGK